MAMKKIYFFLFKIFNIFDSFNVLKVFLLKCYGLKIGKNVLIKKFTYQCSESWKYYLK